MSDSFEFVINSSDRISGTSSDYVVQTRTDNFKLPSGYMPTKCKIIGINFINGMYNVNSTNNVITIFETTATSNTVITLPQGQYNASQLANQIASSFTSASKALNTYTCSYNSQTYLLTITANTNTFYFVNTSLLLGMMGNTTASLTQISTQGIKILIPFVYVRCDIIGEIRNTSKTNVPSSFIIPLLTIDVGASGYIGRESLPLTEHSFIPRNSFKVTIFDENGYVVNLNEFNHSFILEIYR